MVESVLTTGYIEASPHRVVATDREALIALANAQAEALYAVTRDQGSAVQQESGHAGAR